MEQHFLPEYVAVKRSAGRAYFRTILNHVIPPEQVACVFSSIGKKPANKLQSNPEWPYLGSLPLSEISTEKIQRLVLTALSRGYSIQTTVHIRNVLRVIFSHATQTGHFRGENPASSVILPAIIRREVNPLSLTQLRQVVQRMRYPERNVAIFVLLTDLSIAEICGLQWKHLNLSIIARPAGDEFLPAMTIAVRKQIYRGEFGPAPSKRQRLVRIPDVLYFFLNELKARKRFTSPDDLVFVSRNGTPIHPENVAARRLKMIGQSLHIPSLSWRSFCRTRIALSSKYGRQLNLELQEILRGLPGMHSVGGKERLSIRRALSAAREGSSALEANLPLQFEAPASGTPNLRSLTRAEKTLPGIADGQ